MYLALLQVSFPDCVRWTTIEFDPQCGTAQPEDVLRLLIPNRTLHLSNLGGKPLIHDTINTWTELRKFSGSTGWPTSVLVLPGKKAEHHYCCCSLHGTTRLSVLYKLNIFVCPPLISGNELLFSLETASDYVKDEKACFYGFKCVAVGYEFNPGLDEVKRIHTVINQY